MRCRRWCRRIGSAPPLLVAALVIVVVESWTPSVYYDPTSQSRRYSFVLREQQNVEQQNIGNVVNVRDAPFFMTYPRYRIYLSSTSRKRDEELKKKNLFPFLSPILFFSNPKSQLEQEFGLDRVAWLDRKHGLDAYAALWRQSASLHEQATLQMNNNGGNVAMSIVVALPDCQPSIVRHWTEIVNWMTEQESVWRDKYDNLMPVVIDAVILEKHEIPVVKLTARNVMNTTTFPSPPTFATSEADPSIIEARMKSWANRILVSQGICPFTKSASKSGQGLSDVGVPVARVVYHTSHASVHQVYQLMADAWESIADMMAAGPTGKSGVSSILLAAPAFDQDFALWAGPIFAMLEASVIALSAERSIGVVCFHPSYATPDGSSWPGFGHMHSVPRLQQWYEDYWKKPISKEDAAAGGAWQRRTPHATINVLRADQLAAAEGRRATGILYAENIHKLIDVIGCEQLIADLTKDRNLML